jgi:hypothetical protein
MKNLFLLILSALLTIQVPGQEMFEWTEPTAVTDSNSFNANPFVWVNGSDISIMFYEKKFDNTSNAMIYQTELNGDEIEYPLLNDENINYHQPVFLSKGYEGRVGFLLYLADLNGKFELFATEYMTDGSLDKTFLLIMENEDIESFGLSDYNNWLGWNSGGSAYVGQIRSISDTIFVEGVTKLDSVSCSNIVVGNRLAGWEKQIGDSITVNYSRYMYDSGIQEYYWSDPTEIDRLGNEPNLNIDESVWEEQLNILSWVDPDYIKSYDIYVEETFTYSIYDLSEPKHPSGFYWYMAVLSFLPDLYYLSFDAEEAEYREIYCLQSDWGWNDTVQITNNNVEDVNPDLFSGEYALPVNSQYVYCIWQSYRNGKAPLYMSKSKAEVGSGVEESKTTYIPIDISPNPFSGSTEISFELKRNSPVTLSIFTIDGSLIESFALEDKSQTIRHFQWQPKLDLPKGTYLITLQQDGKSSATKVIYK